MSTNLYEILGIQADATPEQIRKAYKKRALQTHPDRAPAMDKNQAEERFRQVNNAYEVLIDPQKRQSYDRHGAWPPPTEDPSHYRTEDPSHYRTEDPPHYTRNNTRSHPFHSNIFTFTDPFEIFDSFFGRASPLHGPLPFGPARVFPDTFFAPPGFSFSPDPFRPPGPFNSGIGMGGGPFRGIFGHDPFMPPMMGGGLFQSQGAGNGGRSASYSSSSYSSRPGTGGGQWISESRSTSTINGLTTSVRECVDSSGNVYTTTTHPDGDEAYMINGIPSASGQTNAPRLARTQHPNPTEFPHRHYRHHRHRDHSRGRHDRHTTYRAYDRDYSPDYHDSRRTSA